LERNAAHLLSLLGGSLSGLGSGLGILGLLLLRLGGSLGILSHRTAT
jgi:hypothetical protein